MTGAQTFRACGAGLTVGAVASVVHLVGRSVLSSGSDPTVFMRHGLWVAANAMGLVGAVLILLALPVVSLKMADSIGVPGLVGAALFAVSWMFFGLFLSLYGILVGPWLAEKAPALVSASAPLPLGVLVAFSASLLFELAGTSLLAIGLLRDRQIRWIALTLPASALLTIVGDLLVPNGPSPSVVTNLLSNAGPILLSTALGALGLRMSWRGDASAQEPERAAPRRRR